jgi:hypothetical protein
VPYVCRKTDRARSSATAEFLLLLRATELARVGLLLDDPAVVNRHRHEVEIAARTVDEGVDDRRQHPELRCQDLPRTTATALDEEFLGVAFTDQEFQVAAEYRFIDFVVAERAADEVRSAAGRADRAARTTG